MGRVGAPRPLRERLAIVVCNGVDKALFETVPFDAEGDARVMNRLTLPSPCLAPVISFGSAGGSWFAVSG